MHEKLEARSFYTQNNQITFALGTILLTSLGWAIAPASASSAIPKQLRPQIIINTPNQPPPSPGSLTGSLLPGDRTTYNLMGTARQNLTINLTSDQLNAMFTFETTAASVKAPERLQAMLQERRD